MAIAGTEIVAGGALAPPAPRPYPTSRTITNGGLRLLGGAHAEAA
jgi:hypothetical protein